MSLSSSISMVPEDTVYNVIFPALSFNGAKHPHSQSPCWLNARFWSGPIYSRVASPASAKHLVATDLLPKRPGYYSAGEQPGEQFGKYSALKRSHHLCLSCILTKNKRGTGDAALLSAAQAL